MLYSELSKKIPKVRVKTESGQVLEGYYAHIVGMDLLVYGDAEKISIAEITDEEEVEMV